ncbi:MAG: polyamine aminopropyltransferase [Victivallaceae bacterium]|nr:polyamine aminopropyltransferase [Victivallaceae bacterium]
MKETKPYWVKEAANGFGLTVEVREHLWSEKTPYQQIDLYETTKVGRMLMLDGIIQLTEFDEFAYQEMMAHPAMFACENPENVLVIGGGDGGVLREIAKHRAVRHMDICEIDERVIAVSRKFLPTLSCGFDDPRVQIHIADGSSFLKDKANCYDVIIVDSTDPGGPGAPLFNADFYQDLSKALRPGGVVATQAESPYLLPDVVRKLYDSAKANFAYVSYGMIFVPTYPTGTIAVCLAGKDHRVDVPCRPVPEEVQKALRYYQESLHHAAFSMPYFVSKLLEQRLDGKAEAR